MKNKVSLSDIARQLGVSKTLVSMVINNKANENGISKETQERVWKKIKQLDYRPNLVARGLRMGRTNTIGLIVSDIANPFYSRIARGIEDQAERKGIHLVICSTDENPEKEIAQIRMFRERQVDGLIISSSQRDNVEFERLLHDDYPFVLVDRAVGKSPASFVGVDNFSGAHSAVTHLIKRGCKNIAAFAVSPYYVSSISDRIDGYQKALKDHGMSYGRKFSRRIPFEHVMASVRKEMTELLSGPDPIDGLFAINNNIAIACIQCLNEMDIKVPGELSFVCFDDIDLFRIMKPSISAVAQPIEAICHQAFSLLMDEIHSGGGVKVKQQVMLSTELVLRDSSNR